MAAPTDGELDLGEGEYFDGEGDVGRGGWGEDTGGGEDRSCGCLWSELLGHNFRYLRSHIGTYTSMHSLRRSWWRKDMRLCPRRGQ